MKETMLSSEKIFDGRIISLRKDEIVTEKGIKQSREVVSHGGGAAVLVVKDGKILLERQFRYPYGEILWEIPAGKRDKGEDFAQTAKRELEEETGYVAEKLVKLFEFYPTPAYTNEIIGIFKAEGLKKGVLHFDEDEDIISEWIPEEKVFEMIENGEIKDGKTLIALLWYKAEKSRREEKFGDKKKLCDEDVAVREEKVGGEKKLCDEDVAVREEKTL